MASRTPFIAGNWKMHTTLDECLAHCDAVRERTDGVSTVEKALCPPFPFLLQARQALAGSTVRLGAQNVHWEDQGAYTGEVSPAMLEGLVHYVIIGHSERRQLFCETDETVNRKLRAALAHSLTPIFCVGETLEERQAGRTEEVLTRQVLRGLDGVPWNDASVIAYEPVWAIGSGLAATAEQARETIAFIRDAVSQTLGGWLADATRIQYGGSVSPDNIAEFVALPEIDGALVGGASLDADAFAQIVYRTAEAKARQA